MRVTGLNLYPVKSLEGVALDGSPLDARGLVGDRRWSVVDGEGDLITAREVHAMLGLTARPLPGGAVEITDRSGESVSAEAPRSASPVPVSQRGQVEAYPAPGEVNDWMSERLGVPARLVWQHDDARRPVRPERGGHVGDVNSLSDAAPILLATDTSLAQLNAWLAESDAGPIGHDRFRANVIVDGAEPFAEDDWASIRIGDVTWRRTMHCDRCVMTTIDRATLATSKEPIRTLARHRKWDGATWFGVRYTPEGPVLPDAHIALGADVHVVA